MDKASLYNQFSDQLLSFIRSKVAKEEDAKDLLHEVYCKVFERIDTVKDDKKIVSWIFQVARNSIVDYYRKNNKKTFSDTGTADFEVSEEDKIINNCLQFFISNLPKNYRSVIRRVDVKGEKYKQVAQELGLSISGVKTRVQRGRQIIKTNLVEFCRYEVRSDGKLYGEMKCDGC